MQRVSPWIGLILSAAALGATGCDTRHRPVPATSSPGTAPNGPAAASASGGVISPVPKNLPVIDTFSGLVPCADCAGIRVQLILFGKRGVKAYRLHEVYVGTPDGDKAVDSEGKAATVAGYEGNPIATVYALNPGDADVARYFLRVDENHLRILNSSKQEIVSRLNYTLTREPPPEPPPTPAPTGESHTS